MKNCPVCNRPFGLIESIMNPSMCVACFKKHSDSMGLTEGEELKSRESINENNRSEVRVEVKKGINIALNSNVKGVFILIIRLLGALVAAVSFLQIILGVIAAMKINSFANGHSVGFDIVVPPAGTFVMGITIILLSRWIIELLAWDMK